MKALLLPVVLALAGVGAGIGAGMFLAPPADESDAGEHDDGHGGTESKSDDGHGAKDDGHGAKDDGHGGGDGHGRGVGDGSVEFARLNNQFIIPVVTDDSVKALVVLSITLEVEPGGTEVVFQNEPRLRDRYLRVLFDHANVGGFDAGFTQSGRMNLLRNALLEVSTEVLGEIVKDVLIVDIIRQET